ncbi:DASH complex subunit [Meyerozyma sp. JA9]|jgi:DASH complex subunit DAD2|nr:DASH complex subunit [Meyerozyma sp. JA9]
MDKPLKSTHIQQKIAEKRAELENLTEIKNLTQNLTSQLKDLETKLSAMSDGTETVALVLSNWQNVVRSVSLASLGLLKYSEEDYKNGNPMPEPLVRIPLAKEEE